MATDVKFRVERISDEGKPGEFCIYATGGGPVIIGGLFYKKMLDALVGFEDNSSESIEIAFGNDVKVTEVR